MITSKTSAFILDCARTAIGSPYKSLRNVSAARLASGVIKAVLGRSKIKNGLVDQVILGNTVSAGTGQNLSRQAALLAGLPADVPAFNVNHVCGSGLQSVILAAQSIRLGDAGLVVAGGTESASCCPKIGWNYPLPNPAPGPKSPDGKWPPMGSGRQVESLIHDGLWCHVINKHMGELAEYIAGQFRISRDEQDRYALQSHQKAWQAQAENKTAVEIVPVELGSTYLFKLDERVRNDVSFEKLKELPAAFKENGTVTAGNSSTPADGAGIVVVASSSIVKEYKIAPAARILGYASIAVKPEMVFTAGIPAIRECLKRCGLAFRDVDLFEISEAFAVQAVLTKRRLKIPEGKMNVFGGDIALGHPLGAAGARILVTLIHALKDQKKKRGIACVCLGGGGAIAMAVEIFF